MMKNFLLLLVAILFSLTCSSQNANWVTTLGGAASDQGTDISIDAAGNVYSCGRFSGTVDFDNGPGVFNLSSNGSTDMYVTKYTASGQFIWAIAMGGVGLDGAYAVEVNNANELILTGYIRNTVDMDPGPGVFNLNGVSSSGVDPGFGGDLFLAKYTSAGALIWAFSVQNDYWQNSGRGIAIDDSDNIFLGGHNNATSSVQSDFDPGPGVAILSGGSNGHAFLAKYTTNGNYVWGFTLGQYGTNAAIVGVEIIPNDTTLIITGHVNGTSFDVDPGPGNVILNAQQEDIFAGRYSFNKAYIWAFNCSGPGIDVARFNAIDSAGNFYTTGVFSNTVDFDPGAATVNYTSSGAFDAFVSKYDINGNYKWTKTFGSTGTDHPWDIGYRTGKVVSVGYFNGTVDFDPTPATFNLSSLGGDDIYITSFDTAGNFICASSIGGVQSEQLWGMKFIHTDTLLINGYYGSNNIDVDPGPGTLLRTNAGSADILFGKYHFQNTSISVTGTIANDTICSGQNPSTIVDFTPNISGSFSGTLTDGINFYPINGITDGIPFNLSVLPSTTTNYTLTINGSINSICSISNFSTSLPITIYVTPQPQITATASPTLFCPGGSTTLNGNGGVSYTWSGGVSNGVSFVPASTSSYTVTGTDANGCTNTSSITITVFPLPNVTANANPANICPGAGTALTGSGASSYTWTGGVSNGVMIYPTTTTTYTVTGTDANGCTNTSSVTVSVNNNLNVNISPTQNTLCLGDSLQLTASGATNYVWSFTPGLSSYTGASVWAFPSASSVYTVTGSDANGCSGTSTVSVDVVNQIEVIASKNRDAECNQNLIQLSASGAQSYTWTPASSLSNPNGAVTNATIYTTTTFYVTGTLGTCTDMDSIVVYNYNNDENSIFIPNAFTPNNDGNNDCLRIRHNAKFTKYYFTIYNRWGEKVFEADNPDACWNGEYKNKPAELDTYFYYLKAESVCGPIFRKGDIVIMR